MFLRLEAPPGMKGDRVTMTGAAEYVIPVFWWDLLSVGKDDLSSVSQLSSRNYMAVPVGNIRV